MAFCLTKPQLDALLKFQVEDSIPEDNELRACFELCKDWETEIVGIDYLFAQIIEKKKKGNYDFTNLINVYEKLEEEMFFTSQGFNLDFLELLMRFLNDRGSDLEDQLVQIQNNLSDYNYHGNVELT